MDIVFNLLKQLATSLSPTEFLTVLVIVAMTSFSIIKFLLTLAKKKGGLQNLLGGQDETSAEIKKISDLSLNASKNAADLKSIVEDLIQQQEQQFEKVVNIIVELKLESKEHAEALRTQITDMLLFKKDIENFSTSVTKELENIKHQMKMHETSDIQFFENVKDTLSKIHNTSIRMISQLEKTDEFARAFVPEFRSYHKELNKELSELSRDIALVERSIQTQINTVNAVKLR